MTNKARAIAAALFDLDGTLADTAPDIAAAVNQMRARFALPALSLARVTQFIGRGTEVLVHRALTDDPQGQASAQEFSRALAAFRAAYRQENGRQARAAEGAQEVLARLRMRGVRLACVTNKPREFSQALLQRLQMDAAFEVLVAGDDGQEKKPHPAGLLAACAVLGVSAQQAVMIGDSRHDALAAQDAGCASIILAGGYTEGVGTAQALVGLDVDAIVNSLPLAFDFLAQRGWLP